MVLRGHIDIVFHAEIDGDVDVVPRATSYRVRGDSVLVTHREQGRPSTSCQVIREVLGFYVLCQTRYGGTVIVKVWSIVYYAISL